MIYILLTILFYHGFLFSIIALYFLIPAVIAQVFNPIAELAIPIAIPTKGEREEMETHQVIVDAKKGKCLI